MKKRKKKVFFTIYQTMSASFNQKVAFELKGKLIQELCHKLPDIDHIFQEL